MYVCAYSLSSSHGSLLTTDTYIIQHKMRIYELCNVSEPENDAKESKIRLKRPKKIGMNARA